VTETNPGSHLKSSNIDSDPWPRILATLGQISFKYDYEEQFSPAFTVPLIIYPSGRIMGAAI
jgi:hypothetical protein